MEATLSPHFLSAVALKGDSTIPGILDGTYWGCFVVVTHSDMTLSTGSSLIS